MMKFSELLCRKLGSHKPKKAVSARTRWAGKVVGGLLTASLCLGLSLPAAANPTGPNVRHGQVNISPGVQTQIQQLTDRAIVDWQSFSIGANEAVRILQPSQLAVMLNRVTGGDASQILGQLEANGQVFLINPNGILFGPGSMVNVGGLVASTLNITDENFLAGNYNFTQDVGQDLAAVVNQGSIRITDGGYAVLTGPSVINEGTIIARAGNVRLAAGEQATLNLDGRDLVHFALAGQVSDGTVLLAPGMMSDAISQTLGVEQAQRADKLVRMDDGSVRMVSSSGTLVQAGSISADGRENLDAGSVRLDSTDLTVVASGSVTSASGQGLNSNAGEVIAISHMDGDYTPMSRTLFQSGSLLAAAGGETGDAGFIEVSGEWVDPAGDVDLSRTHGAVGLFLLDPPDVVVVDDSFVDDGRFGTATLVTDQFLENGLTAANFTIQNFSLGSVTLDVRGTSGGADTGIQVAGTGNQLTIETPGGTFVDFNTDDVQVSGDLFVNAGGDVRLGTGNIQVGTDFDIAANNDIFLESATITAVGDFNPSANGTLDLGNSQVTAGSASLEAFGAGVRGDGASLDTRGTPSVANDGGDLFLSTSGDIILDNTTLQFDAASAGGGLSITADGDITITSGLIESDFEQLPMAAPTYFADLGIESMFDSITLTDTDVLGANVFFTASGNIDHSGGSGPRIDATGDFSSFSESFTGNSISAGGSVLIDASTGPISSITASSISGSDVTLTGGSINLDDAFVTAFTGVTITGESFTANGNASIQTPQQFIVGGPTVITPEISISVTNSILMNAATTFPASTGGLRSLRVILETTAGASTDVIIAALNTTDDDFTSGLNERTRLTASSGGNITINDIADSQVTFAQGIDLVRPGGLPGTSAAALPAISSGGAVNLFSEGNLGFGLGDGTTPDLGQSLVQAQGRVDIRTLLRMLDQNSALSSPELLEIETLGPVQLIAGTVGDFNGGTQERIEIDGASLVVDATVTGQPIHVASQNDLAFIDVRTTGGEVLVTENISTTTGGTIRHQPLVVGGPNVLQISQANPIQANLVRFESDANIVVDKVDVTAGQTVIISTTTRNNASILNGTPGSGNANITNNGTLVLNAEGSVGSLTDFLVVEGDALSVSAGTTATSSLFLDLAPLSPSTTVDIEGVDTAYLIRELSLLLPNAGDNPESINVENLVIIDVDGGLNVDSLISADNGIAVTSIGTVDLTPGLQSSNGNVLVEANQITNGDNGNLAGIGVGLSLAQDFGTNADFIELSAGQQLVLGNNPTVNYFLETGGLDENLTWVDSLTVGNKTITGNQVNILEHTHTDQNIIVNGNITASDRIVLSASSQDVAVNSTINATNRAEVRATGSITQGSSGPNDGLIDSAAILLDAGGDIGAIADDQQINGGTLALSAGGNAYVQDRVGDLTVVNDGTLSSPAGAGQDLRVRTDNGDLTLNGDLQANEAAFVAGTNLTINAQTTGQDIFINGTTTSNQNMTFLAVGDIIPGVGSMLTVTGATNGLGLGAGGTIGAVNPVIVDTPNIALNPANANIQAVNTPTPVASVTAVGVTVNAQIVQPPDPPQPNPNPAVVVDVTLQPVVPNPVVIAPGVLVDPQFFAQNDVNLVDRDIKQLLGLQDLLDDILDPTEMPVGWWDDEDFMRRKFRR